MYVHPAFHIDRAASLAFAAERGFGVVIACDAGRPVASPLPFATDFEADGTPRVSFHVARNNPLAGLAARGGDWLVAVTGADAYVSPDWYASPDQVPTWLYEAVHLTGPVRVTATEAMPQHLDALGEKFESWLDPKPHWRADGLTPARRKMLMKGIVGIEMTVATVEGSLKLNQHKSDADHVAIADALARQNDTGARALAQRMMAMRPHLAYQPEAALDDRPLMASSFRGAAPAAASPESITPASRGMDSGVAAKSGNPE